MEKEQKLKNQLEQLKVKKENLERHIRLIELKLERMSLSAQGGKPSSAKE